MKSRSSFYINSLSNKRLTAKELEYVKVNIIKYY